MVTKEITLESTHGATETVILGARDLLDTTFQGCGPNAVRCAYMERGTLKGFTLAGGAAGSENLEDLNNRGGGLCTPQYSNLPLLLDCIVSNNAALRGGGAYGGTFHRCLVSGNFAQRNGGGVRESVLYDSLIVYNTGGGTYACYSPTSGKISGLYNCTVARNIGTGLDQSSGYNTISVENTTAFNVTYATVTFENCCLSSATTRGTNNIVTTNVRFVDSANGNFRLLADSPCVDAADPLLTGNAPAATNRTDYLGSPRLQGVGLDIGAIERVAPGIATVDCIAPSGAGSLSPLGYFVLPTLPTQLVFSATAYAGAALRHFTVNGAKMMECGNTFTINVTQPRDYIVSAVFLPARYVDATSGSDANNGTSPENAWRTLQFAANNAAIGTLVLAAPGIYNEGLAYGASHSNRVSIKRNIVLKSSAGPEQTVIMGAKDFATGDANGRGPAAMRCVHMTTGTLEGFTLTGGASSSGANDLDPVRGGGLHGISCEIWDCVISNNVASRGSALWGGTLRRCRIENNLASHNGAARNASLYDSLIVNNRGPWAIAYGCQLYNCTVSGNTGGGVSSSTTSYNTIVYGNTGLQAESTAVFANSCVGGALHPGTGNISADPKFIDPESGDFRLQPFSPCVDKGNLEYGTGVGGTDLDGEQRVFGSQVDMGAYEDNTARVRISAGVKGKGTITPSGYLSWETIPMSQSFIALPDPGHELLYFSTNNIAIPNTGNSLVLSSATDLTLNLLAHFSAGTFYADASQADDSGDGVSWLNAKRTLQAAVDLAGDGDTVLAAPGTYNQDTRVTPTRDGYLLNRIAITNNITLRSRDGASATIIQGAFDTGSGDQYGRGPNAVRCAYLEKGTLQGFTLTGGATDSVDLENENNRGGAVYASNYNYTPLVLDCVISNNASMRGGGSHAGTLKRCIIRDNCASKNSSGVRGSYAYHCLIANNRTCGNIYGSACAFSWLYNCTVADNEGRAGDATEFYNCILTELTTSSRHFDSCINSENIIPVTNDNCIVAAPLFANASAYDYRLSAGSPCIDRANSAYVDNRFGTDLNGTMRMQNARVDLGAYEWDWRPTFAADLDANGLTVAEVTPFVTHATDAAYTGGSALYLDGAAALANGQETVDLSILWNMASTSTVYLSFQVDGSGTLALYEDDVPIASAALADGYQTLKHTVLNRPGNLRAVYTVGIGETGGALLDAFESASGLILLLR